MMDSATLEEKENERHTTDRFIPLRKHSSPDTLSPYSFI
jgi:hypothetical protein